MNRVLRRLRIESVNALLCLVLGAAIGGAMSLGLRLPAVPLPDRRFEVKSVLVISGNDIAARDASWQTARAFEDPQLCEYAMLNVLTRTAIKDVGHALALLDDVSDAATRKRLLAVWLHDRLMPLRPDLAVQVAWRLSDAVNCADAHFAWQRRDAPAAVACLCNAPDRRFAEKVLQAMAASAMRRDPRCAAQMIIAYPAAELRAALLPHLLQQWSVMDAEEALRYVETLPPALLTPQCLEGIGVGLAQMKPERLVALIKRLTPAARGKVAEDITAVLPAVASFKDASRFMGVIGGLPTQGKATSLWASSLGALAPEEAEAWINAMPPGVQRDQATCGYLRSYDALDREAALEWAGQIGDMTARLSETQHQWLAWVHEDRAAALAWAAALPPDERQASLMKLFLRAGMQLPDEPP